MPSPQFDSSEFQTLLADLAEMSDDLETGDRDWPGAQFDRLTETGVAAWVIPREFGGMDVSSVVLTEGYAHLASACLTTTFVLTQRNGACQRIAGSQNAELKRELLPGLCRGETFATVGVSHLTTSRQHLKQPAMRVEQRGGTFVFDGFAPWVTGASQADYIVTGGTCADGRQVLAAVPTGLPGVSVQRAPRLLALNESQTASVELSGVGVEEKFLLAGPVDEVMKSGVGGGTGSLTTSALAVGAARGTLNRFQSECQNRPDLGETWERLSTECESLQAEMVAAAGGDAAAVPPVAEIRARANSLVVRAAHAYLTAAKGSGFVAGHPAERSVREAAFFLVWSCPQPVQTAAMREFACALQP